MLSILIPVYNFDVNNLVEDLLLQCKQSRIDFEILCFDDGSTEYFLEVNKPLHTKDGIDFRIMEENLGRSRIRNRLAEAAKYPYLLFMDCDSRVVRKDYIQKYLAHVRADRLVYGGRVYQEEAPQDTSLLFHWHYGIQREQVDYRIRQQQPYHAFQTNNFLVPKDRFLEIRFEESLRQYGHEDTLFGFELKKHGVEMLHIDNPLEHIGLETVDSFLNKTKKGIENLLKLQQQYPHLETKLLKAYRFCQKSGLHFPVSLLFRFFKNRIEKNLRSNSPNLRYFDFYKLAIMFSSS